MKINIRTHYRGFSIWYDEDENKWGVSNSTLRVEGSDGLSALKDEIDAAYTKTRLKVIFIGRGASKHEAQSGTISRINFTECWSREKLMFHYPNGNYRQVDLKNIILDTPENRAKLNEIEEITNQMTSLSLKRTDLERAMKASGFAEIKSTMMHEER